MRLVSLFEQRKIGPTHGSMASLIPLRTPSGPQYTESELETDLVQQLVFSGRVSDLITQPIIFYSRGGKELRYTPDVLVELRPDRSADWRYYLLEAKPVEHLEGFRAEAGEKIRVATMWCEQNLAAFRILTEKQIRTPYLGNSKLLGRYLGMQPEAAHLEAIMAVLASGPVTVSQTISQVHAVGIEEPDARLAIERSVANRLVTCDLARPFDDSSILALNDNRHEGGAPNDPILRLMEAADPS